MPDHLVFFDDTETLGTALEMIQTFMNANMMEIAEKIGLATISEDVTSTFILQLGPMYAAVAEGGAPPRPVFVRDDTGQEPELHQIEEVQVLGEAVIHVSEVSLTHRRLGEVMYAYGEGTVGGRKALLLFTENEGGGKATIRIRPADEG